MRKLAWAVLGLMLIGGCSAGERPLRIEQAPELRMFEPVKMRIHPIFTQIKDWNNNGKPDGIEAEVEFTDQFNDPTKAAGRIIFELYDYRKGYPDPRGDRLVNPWVAELLTPAQQREHWNRTSRTYSFKLAYPGISQNRQYVLSAIFEPVNGPRMFDRIILRGEEANGASGKPAGK